MTPNKSFFERFRKEFILVGILLVAALGVLVGSGIAYKVGAVSSARYEKLEILAKVLYLVENNYVREVDEKELIYGAINGLLATLDPHSTYLPPETYKEMQVETRGKFQGIGIEITLKEGSGLTVVSPIEDTPGDRAGLKSGDAIIAIDGEFTKDMTLADAVTRMRGSKGSKVRLTIMREGFKKPKDFVIARDTIRIKSVKYKVLESGYGYVRVTSFQERSNYDLNKAIDNMEAKEGKLKGLVLDLRNNPGGLLDQAIKVADTFLTSGKIVITKGRNKKQIKVEEAHERGTRDDFPMIVLVNGGSASASEIVAGALQDNKRAVVLGTRTFGKGTVQTVIDLDDGSGLKLTIARYFTPNEHDIQERGIVPDIFMEQSFVDAGKPKKINRRYLREADLKGHLQNVESGDKPKSKEDGEMFPDDSDSENEDGKESPKDRMPRPGDLTEDIQLKAALDYLKTWDVFKAHALKRTPSKDAPTAANASGQF